MQHVPEDQNLEHDTEEMEDEIDPPFYNDMNGDKYRRPPPSPPDANKDTSSNKSEGDPPCFAEEFSMKNVAEILGTNTTTVTRSVAKVILGSSKTRRAILTKRPTSFWA